ncbi:MAG TPA: sulfotransferase [Parafilimonas sp.]|nr:sulfotransferase [Parafilimonas sp.]
MGTTKFVIFTLPRTGSTLLSKSLNKHPEIFCDDEIFHFSFRDYFSPHQFRFWKFKFVSKKINYVINYPRTFFILKTYLDDFFTNASTENFRARGFKLMYYQTFYTPGLLSYLTRNHIKVILLIRENVFRNAISDLRARATGIYHYQDDGEPSQPLSKLLVDTNALQGKMQHIIDQNKKLEAIVSGMDHIKIRYEDLSDWDDAIRRITDFLGVSNVQVPEAARKLNPESISDMIENVDEVRTWLQKNGYARFEN